MKKVMIGILAAIFLLLIPNAFAAQISGSLYKQNVVVSEGGENMSSSSYKIGIAAGIINSIISSASYINKLGFFHTWLLADGQPCTSASQCEGGFCCSNLCRSSACPEAAPSEGGAGAAAAGGGGAALIEEKVKDFSVSPSSIKEHIALGAAKTQPLRIKNTGNVNLSFGLDVLTVSDFVFLSDTSFSLKPGEEKNLEANIIGKKLGSYIGEIAVSGDGISKSISVVIEVESEQVLFDVKMDIPSAYKEVEAGKDLKAQITLFNVGPARKVDVTPTYIIKDRQGNVIYEKSETFAVEQQASYVKSFRIPQNANPGDYLAIVELRYENSFAVSSELFKVIPKEPIDENAVKLKTAFMFVLAVFVGLMFLFVYLLMPKLRIFGKGNFKKFYKIVNEIEDALNSNDISKAKELYIDARNLFVGLGADEKRAAYDKLKRLYDKIKNN